MLAFVTDPGLQHKPRATLRGLLFFVTGNNNANCNRRASQKLHGSRSRTRSKSSGAKVRMDAPDPVTISQHAHHSVSAVGGEGLYQGDLIDQCDQGSVLWVVRKLEFGFVLFRWDRDKVEFACSLFIHPALRL